MPRARRTPIPRFRRSSWISVGLRGRTSSQSLEPKRWINMSTDVLKFGTFNIRTTAVGNTGRLRWNRRREVIESLIQRQDPDILALQEVTNRTHGIPNDVDQLQWLADTFPRLEA